VTLLDLPRPVRGQETLPRLETRSRAPQDAERLRQQFLKLDSEGKYDAAMSLAECVLAIYAPVLGPEHLEFTATLAYLGFLYTKKGDYDYAEMLYQRALALREKALGPEHPELVVIHNHLSMLHVTKGDFDRAASHYQRALEIREKVLGPEHPEVARTLNTLGHVFTSFKVDYNRAESLQQRALAVREQTLGPMRPKVAPLLHHLAELYTAIGDYSRAEPLLQRALAIRQQRLGPENPQVAEILTALAHLSCRAKDGCRRAEPLYQRALVIGEKLWGPQNSKGALTLDYLALLYTAKGEIPCALALKTQASEYVEHQLALFLATGSEEQKRAYAATLITYTDNTVTFHTHSAPSDPQALRLALTTVLRRKGRVLDAMDDSLITRLLQRPK
jgi:tetratricopeptide (TPR) repeat protein